MNFDIVEWDTELSQNIKTFKLWDIQYLGNINFQNSIRLYSHGIKISKTIGE